MLGDKWVWSQKAARSAKHFLLQFISNFAVNHQPEPGISGISECPNHIISLIKERRKNSLKTSHFSVLTHIKIQKIYIIYSSLLGKVLVPKICISSKSDTIGWYRSSLYAWNTVSCIHYHKEYSWAIWEYAHNYLHPFLQSKQNVHNQCKLKSSPASRWKTGGKHSQGNEATGEENGNSHKTKKKPGPPLCSQTLPPSIAHRLLLSCSLPHSSTLPRMSYKWSFRVNNLLRFSVSIIPLRLILFYCWVMYHNLFTHLSNLFEGHLGCFQKCWLWIVLL
jgi:hypothetical protein